MLRYVLPFAIEDRGYGATVVLHLGSMITYVYNLADERQFGCVISRDGGEVGRFGPSVIRWPVRVKDGFSRTEFGTG